MLSSTIIQIAVAVCGPAFVKEADGAATQVSSPTTSAPASAPEARTANANMRRDDATVPVPGLIEPDLNLVNRDPSNWLGIPPEKEWLNLVRDPLKRLDTQYGLAITGAYTMLFQQSIGPGERSAAAGDFDFNARWTLLGRDTLDTGSFYFNAEYRHEIGDNPPSALGGEIGTLLGTTNGFNDRGWAVKDAYWAQRLFDDHFRIGFGRVDAENLVGGYQLQSANTSFLNKAFSTNPTIAFPGSGMGAAASIRPVDWIYVSAGATNAYGNTTQIEIDSLFEDWRLFEFAEVGYTPTIEGVGKGRYRIAMWHMDSRAKDDKPADGGFSLIADQEVGERISLFARYGYADGDLTRVRQSAQVGAGFEGLFGSTSDLTGIAAAWSQPVDDLRDEKVIEVFHRLQLTGRVQLTFGMQCIFDPSNNPEVDALGVFSTRLRITF